MEKELMERNYQIFIMKLNEIGINTEELNEKYGNLIKTASFAMDTKYGLAYEGALLDTILRVLTPFAVKLNNLLPENIQVKKESLVKVCLLHQISKCQMFVPNDNEWEREKRGLLYKYGESNVAFKCGMKSFLICNKLGIKFTDEEIEALTIMDRDDNDMQAKVFCNPLSAIIRQANELTTLKKRLGA